MAESRQAPNIVAILEWCKANRPDATATVETILAAEARREPQATAMLWLLVAGFQAGRQYQIDHPTLGSHSYHTDPPMLHHAPRTSTQIAADRAIPED